MAQVETTRWHPADDPGYRAVLVEAVVRALDSLTRPVRPPASTPQALRHQPPASPTPAELQNAFVAVGAGSCPRTRPAAAPCEGKYGHSRDRDKTECFTPSGP